MVPFPSTMPRPTRPAAGRDGASTLPPVKLVLIPSAARSSAPQRRRITSAFPAWWWLSMRPGAGRRCSRTGSIRLSPRNRRCSSHQLQTRPGASSSSWSRITSAAAVRGFLRQPQHLLCLPPERCADLLPRPVGRDQRQSGHRCAARLPWGGAFTAFRRARCRCALRHRQGCGAPTCSLSPSACGREGCGPARPGRSLPGRAVCGRFPPAPRRRVAGLGARTRLR